MNQRVVEGPCERATVAGRVVNVLQTAKTDFGKNCRVRVPAGNFILFDTKLDRLPTWLELLDFGHSTRFATHMARDLAGDLYPGPVLMPRGYLRALDPLVAVALGPAREGRETFRVAFRRTLRGRPDGPLLLALWGTISAGEISSTDLRSMVNLMKDPLPEELQTRQELLAFAQPRAQAVARCALQVLQRPRPEAQQAAEALGIGLFLTHLLIRLPEELCRGHYYLPTEDLESCQLSRKELETGVFTSKVERFLRQESDWSRHYLDLGLGLSDHIGARLRRGLRAMVLRARGLLDMVEDPNRDLFRRPPRLGPWDRWRFALRSLGGIPLETQFYEDAGS